MAKKKVLKNKNATNKYNSIRQKEINEVLDYDKNISRRAFQLEKDEFIKNYPDQSAQMNMSSLNPAQLLQFNNICDKFISYLLYFTNQVSLL